MSGTDPFVFDDPLARQSPEDTDAAWGDGRPSGDEDLDRFLAEKPPHHF
ncbi:hypothetical protein GCM10027168_06800 [Streptomyces capparidis]